VQQSITAIQIVSVPVTAAQSVRDLAEVDAGLLMRIHVKRTFSRCFATLRQLRQVRRLVPTTTLQTVGLATHTLRDGLRQRRAGLIESQPICYDDYSLC